MTSACIVSSYLNSYIVQCRKKISGTWSCGTLSRDDFGGQTIKLVEKFYGGSFTLHNLKFHIPPDPFDSCARYDLTHRLTVAIFGPVLADNPLICHYRLFN